MEEQEIAYLKQLDSFKKANNAMIATNDSAYANRWESKYRKMCNTYTEEEIQRIIENGTILEQQQLSRFFFAKEGIYKRIIMHYATLLKYVGILIPNPGYGKQLSADHVQKKYYAALDFIEKANLPILLSNCAQKAFTEGCYYGVITNLDKTSLAILDLPSAYCISNFKDIFGNDIIEFNLSYFNTIAKREDREAALNAYPKFISSAYRKYVAGKLVSNWIKIPSDIGICFPFLDGKPPFLSVITTISDYKDTVTTEKEKNADEVKKIIVQKIPHNATTNELLFEPEEAEIIHAGTVGMMKGNKNVSVLTTYADVEAIVSKTQNESDSMLTNMADQIYLDSGASNQMFSATGSVTTDASVRNDIAFVMTLANKFSRFITNVINSLYSNSNVSFKYQILPISYQNDSKFIEDSFKLASSGYSLIIPALALGITQKDLINIKDLENELLKIGEKLIPPTSQYNSTGMNTSVVSNKPGRPAKDTEDKKESTIAKDKSIEKRGGAN